MQNEMGRLHFQPGIGRIPPETRVLPSILSFHRLFLARAASYPHRFLPQTPLAVSLIPIRPLHAIRPEGKTCTRGLYMKLFVIKTKPIGKNAKEK